MILRTLDAAGNEIGEFSVVRLDDGSQLETFSVGLAGPLCEALAERT